MCSDVDAKSKAAWSNGPLGKRWRTTSRWSLDCRFQNGLFRLFITKQSLHFPNLPAWAQELVGKLAVHNIGRYLLLTTFLLSSSDVIMTLLKGDQRSMDGRVCVPHGWTRDAELHLSFTIMTKYLEHRSFVLSSRRLCEVLDNQCWFRLQVLQLSGSSFPWNQILVKLPAEHVLTQKLVRNLACTWTI